MFSARRVSKSVIELCSSSQVSQNTAKEAPMQKKQSTSPVIVKAERLAPWLPDRASPGIAWAVLDPGAAGANEAHGYYLL